MSLFSPCRGEILEKFVSLRSRTLFFLLLIAAPLGARFDPSSGSAVLERRLLVMGTELVLVVRAADRPAAVAASEAALRALEAAESRLSTWRPGSELSALNRSPAGSALELSQATAGELSEALECRRWTEGAFDPTIGSLSDALGLRSGGRKPPAAELAAARAATGADLLRVTATRAVRLHPSVRVDEGGFGKGAGLDRALAALDAIGGVRSARLDLGGQVATYGPGPWRLALAHPADRRRPVLEVEIAGGSLATSGNSERGIAVAGGNAGRRAHILDPRRGEPVADFGSLAVWAPGALEADCLSTGLYVLGPTAALAWAAAHPPVAVAVLEPTAGGGVRARLSPALARGARALESGVTIEIWKVGREDVK